MSSTPGSLFATLPPRSDSNLSALEQSLQPQSRHDEFDIFLSRVEQQHDEGEEDSPSMSRASLWTTASSALTALAPHSATLQWVPVSKAMMKQVCAALPSRCGNTLHTLSFRNCSLDLVTVSLLADAVRGHAALQRVAVEEHEEGLGLGSLQALCSALSSVPHLKSVALWKNKLEPDDGRAVAAMVKACRGLKVLDVSDNELGADGVRAIVEQVARHESMVELDVGANDIGEVGARSLAALLKENNSLHVLRTYWNELGDTGACHIVEALKSVNRSLLMLDMRWCGITAVAGPYLLDLLDHNEVIHTLRVYGEIEVGTSQLKAEIIDKLAPRKEEMQDDKDEVDVLALVAKPPAAEPANGSSESAQIAELQALLAARDAEIERLEIDLAAAEAHRVRSNASSPDTSQLHARIQQLEDRLASKEERPSPDVSQLRARLQRFEEELAAKNAEITRLRKAQQNVQDPLVPQLRAHVKDLESELELADSQLAELPRLRAHIRELEEQGDAELAHRDQLRSRVRQLEDQVASLSQELKQQKTSIKSRAKWGQLRRTVLERLREQKKAPQRSSSEGLAAAHTIEQQAQRIRELETALSRQAPVVPPRPVAPPRQTVRQSSQKRLSDLLSSPTGAPSATAKSACSRARCMCPGFKPNFFQKSRCTNCQHKKSAHV